MTFQFINPVIALPMLLKTIVQYVLRIGKLIFVPAIKHNVRFIPDGVLEEYL
jgi:hypothetical protein